MDADDFSYPERFMHQVDLFESDPTMTACGTAVRLMGAPSADPGRGFLNYVDWVNALNAPNAVASQRFIDSPVANPTSMIRANDLEKVGGFSDPTWAEDYDLWLNLLNRKRRITNIKKVLLDWHDSPKRLTRSSSRYSLNNFSKAKAHYLAKLPNTYQPLGIEISEELARLATERLSDRKGKVLAMSAIEGLSSVPEGTKPANPNYGMTDFNKIR